MGKRGCIYKYFILILCFCVFIKWILPYTRFGYYSPVYEDMFCRLNKTQLVMKAGERKKIRVIGVNQRAVFFSTDFKVAEVDFGGNVYAHKNGTAIIVVKTNTKQLKCKVKVVS